MSTSPIEKLRTEFGETLTAVELARFLHLHRDTVIKYADRWGGIEVSPGKWRFFMEKVRRQLNASENQKAGNSPMDGLRNGEWSQKTETVPGCKPKIVQRSRLVGGGNKKGVSRGSTNSHGITYG